MKKNNNGLFTGLLKEVSIKSKDLEINYEGELNLKHTEEAKEHGLELLYRANSRVYGWYRIVECKHEMFLHYGAVRKATSDKFKCTQCMVEKLKAEAILIGATLLGTRENCKTSEDNNYLFPCGHTVMLRAGNVRLGVEKCRTCTQLQHEKELEDSGLVLVSYSNKKRTYKLPCGHFKSIKLQSVRDGSWICRTCREDRYAKEAVKSGITMNRNVKYSHHDYRNYTLACGCSKEIAVACVRKLTFECKNHSERFIDYSKSISVYLVKFKLEIGEYLKIGFAMDTSGRFSRYGLIGDCEPLFIQTFENGQDAVNFEKQLHTKYKEFNVDRETLRPFMNNGYTECYPVEMQNVLLAEFREELNV